MKLHNKYKDIYEKEGGVIELIQKDFIYKQNKLFIHNKLFQQKGFIVFYAPWCKHCVHLSNILIDIGLYYQNIFSIGAVNVENIKDHNDKLAIYANITSLPTIKYVTPENTLEEYIFDYTLDNLIYYIDMNK